MIVIHLIPHIDWEGIQGEPQLFSESIVQYGFIHCCLPEQMQGVLKHWFTAQKDVIAVEIDANLLISPLVFENLEGGSELFPHIYGLVNRDAVVRWYPADDVEWSLNMEVELKEIPFDKFLTRVFKLWDKDWLALTSGDFAEHQFNAMTVAWGSFGIMWNKPFVMVVVRPTRHSFKFINQYDTFSLCAFPEEFRKSLNILGTQSGRDLDKIKVSGLTAIKLDKITAPGYAEAELTLQCKRIYWQDLDPSKFLDASIEDHYEKKDYHRMIFGEILAIHGNFEKYSV